MYHPPAKTPIGTHLKYLHTLCYYCGLIHFTFNPLKCRFEFSKRISRISAIVNISLIFICGFYLFGSVLLALTYYTNIQNVTIEGSAINAQDTLLMDLNTRSHLCAGYFLAMNFKKLRRLIVPTLNKVVVMFQKISSQTESAIYIDMRFQNDLVFKICVTVIISIIQLFSLLVSFLLMIFNMTLLHDNGLVAILIGMTVINLFAFYIQVITSLFFLSHVYSQLSLICIYLKMNEYLATHRLCINRRILLNIIRNYFRISFEVNRVKRGLDKFFMPTFFVSYMKAFTQIFNLYQVLKVLFYGENISLALAINFPVFLGLWFDIYLLGRLSDMLVDAEEQFRRLMLEIIVIWNLFRSKSLDRRMDLALIQSNVCGVGTMTFWLDRVDQQFSFDYLMNFIFAYVITFLQYYASEEIYSPVNNNPPEIELNDTMI